MTGAGWQQQDTKVKDAEEQALRMMQLQPVGHGVWPKVLCVMGGWAWLGRVHIQHC